MAFCYILFENLAPWCCVVYSAWDWVLYYIVADVCYLFNSHIGDWSQGFFLLFDTVLCLSACQSFCLYPRVVMCVTVPLAPLLCNCLGLGWQSRPDKRTQIVSGDRLKRSVCSLLYLSSSITCVWQKQCCMIDGCSALSLSASHSVHSVSLSLTHFSPLGFPSFSHHLPPPFFCNLSLFSLSDSVFRSLSFFLHEVLSLLFLIACAWLRWCVFVCVQVSKRQCRETESFKLLGQSDLSFYVCCHLSVCCVVLARVSDICAYIQFSTLHAAGIMAWLSNCK